MALLLVSFSLFVLAKGLIAGKGSLKDIQWKNQAVLVGAVFVYGWLLDFAGFLLSTLGLMFVLFGLLSNSKGRWPGVFLYAAATASVGWLVFSVALKVPFPRGHLMVVAGWIHGILR